VEIIESKAQSESSTQKAQNEVAALQIPQGLQVLQIKDAASHAARLNPRTSYSYLFPKFFKLFPIAAFPFLLFPLLPYKPAPAPSHASEELRNVIREEGRSLIESAQNLGSEKPKNPELSAPIDLLAAEMMELGKRLKSDRLSKKEALKGISELSSKIQTEQERAKDEDFSKTLDGLSKSLNAAEIFERNRASQADLPSQKLSQLADKLEASQLTPEMRKELELLLKDLKDLVNKFNQAKAPDKLQLQLQALVESSGRSPLSPERLRKLTESLKRIEKRQHEIEALQLMMAQLQKSKSKIAMKGLNLELDFDLESKFKLAKRQPSPGHESTNLQAIGGKTEASSPSDFNKSESMNHRQLEAEGKAEAEFKPNYAPTRLNRQGSELTLEGLEAGGNEKGKSLLIYSIYSREKPEVGDFSLVPYQQVYHQYRSVADDAISKERIPLQYRNLIKAYFEAINPDKDR
jgi:hypothetical protein